jgi:transposase
MVASEGRSARYLLERCKTKAAFACPVCRGTKLYVIEDGKRRRCALCGHSFPPFSGRWLNKMKISSREWLWAMKLFDLELPAAAAAEEIGISYPTLLKTFGVIRAAIAQNAVSAFTMAPDAEQETTVFRISGTDDAGTCGTAIAEDLVLLKLNLGSANIVLARKSVTSPVLSWSGSILAIADLGKQYPYCKVYSSERGFWPYAKERLMRHHGVSFDKLPLYLREINFRWKNRNGTLLNTLVDLLCNVTPGETSEMEPLIESQRPVSAQLG